MPSRARDTPTQPGCTPHPGMVVGEERARLARTFGAVLAAERTGRLLTQRQLGEQAGLATCTVSRLEGGRQRPTAGVVWRLAKALRPNADLRTRVALDVRLRLAAGESLRDYTRRPRVRRQRIEAELLATDTVPVVEDDDFGAFAVTLLAVSDE